jgi:hypothetical protein
MTEVQQFNVENPNTSISLSSKFDFGLAPDLKSGGSLVLATNEKVVFTWQYDSEALTGAE